MLYNVIVKQRAVTNTKGDIKMKFKKYDFTTKQAARKGGEATARKWAAIRAERERAAREPKEQEAYRAFIEAEEGIFDGFKMANVFHKNVDKNGCILFEYADDVAMCEGVSVGADGIACYFFTEPEKVKKQVRFNRSVYLF